MSFSHLLPMLVVSYSDEARAVMSKTLKAQGVEPAPCLNFLEAERLALSGLYSGLLVDLPSMVKSKGEEKIVSCSLGNFYPILRVRVMGAVIIPMGMSGGASQDKSLADFLSKTCSTFSPRKLRSHKRHRLHTPVKVYCHGKCHQGFTQDLSWGGSFVATNRPDRYEVGDDIVVEFPTLGFVIHAAVCRVQPWGKHKVVPGVGIRWHLPVGDDVEAILMSVLKTNKDHDLDRVVA